jgi:hypothetical protein
MKIAHAELDKNVLNHFEVIQIEMKHLDNQNLILISNVIDRIFNKNLIEFICNY